MNISMRQNDTEFTQEQIISFLYAPMTENDADAKTIGGYLHKLLYTLWQEGEGFSSKRPFGNSYWEHDLYIALGKNGHVEMTFDEDGYIEMFEAAQKQKARRIIFACINQLFKYALEKPQNS